MSSGPTALTERLPRHPVPVYFDEPLDAWLISRYRDVLDVLRDRRAVPSDAKGRAGCLQGKYAQAHRESSTLTVKSRTAQLDVGALRALTDTMIQERLHGSLDFIEEFAKPWAVRLAGLALGIEYEAARGLAGYADGVFLASSDPYDDTLQALSAAATAQIARYLHAYEPICCQLFIAICTSVPYYLGNCVAALCEHPQQSGLLRSGGSVLDTAVEELLRYAGPSAVQFRLATADMIVAGVTIESGQKLFVLPSVANRDPAQFRTPDVLDIKRTPLPHLALGAGPHSCIGANAVRKVVRAALEALSGYLPFVLEKEVTWKGFAIRYVEELRLNISGRSVESAPRVRLL